MGFVGRRQIASSLVVSFRTRRLTTAARTRTRAAMPSPSSFWFVASPLDQSATPQQMLGALRQSLGDRASAVGSVGWPEFKVCVRCSEVIHTTCSIHSLCIRNRREH
jgi:hypothetical protein